jgi:rhodanese-related sulfurtransferase
MSIERISPEEAQAALADNPSTIYLDVRTPGEFTGGHVPGAVNVPVAVRGAAGMSPNPDFLDEVNVRFAKDTPIITGCLRGGRSLRAAGALIGDGFVNVVDMRGGWDGEMDAMGNIAYPGWQRRGLPVEG